MCVTCSIVQSVIGKLFVERRNTIIPSENDRIHSRYVPLLLWYEEENTETSVRNNIIIIIAILSFQRRAKNMIFYIRYGLSRSSAGRPPRTVDKRISVVRRVVSTRVREIQRVFDNNHFDGTRHAHVKKKPKMPFRNDNGRDVADTRTKIVQLSL